MSSGQIDALPVFTQTIDGLPALPLPMDGTALVPARLGGATYCVPANAIAALVQQPVAYTVATLPRTPGRGQRAYVTDATSPTFLGALTGGGAVVAPVFYNGTAWVAGG